MSLKNVKPFLLALIIIGMALVGISIYSVMLPEKEALEFRLNAISMLSGFSYIIFALIVWNLFVKKR